MLGRRKDSVIVIAFQNLCLILKYLSFGQNYLTSQGKKERRNGMGEEEPATISSTSKKNFLLADDVFVHMWGFLASRFTFFIWKFLLAAANTTCSTRRRNENNKIFRLFHVFESREEVFASLSRTRKTNNEEWGSELQLKVHPWTVWEVFRFKSFLRQRVIVCNTQRDSPFPTLDILSQCERLNCFSD